MPVAPLPTWQSTLADLPAVSDASWSLNFAGWYADQIAEIQPDPAALVDANFTFTFNEAIFATQLASLAPNPDAAVAALGLANAWEAAILDSVALNVPGAFIPPATPSTTFSVVLSTIIDPPSIAEAKTKLLDLASAAPTDDPLQSEFPEIFRDATLLLSITVTGLSSDPPPPAGPGPLPLTAPLVPLI